MTWFYIAITAQFLYAMVFIMDRVLLTKFIYRPIVYTFYAGCLSVFAFVLAPFGLVWPSLGQFFIALLTGVCFLVALILFYRALIKFDASRVVPLVGSLTPLFSLLIVMIFLGRYLIPQEFVAFSILFFGGVLISAKKNLITSLQCFLSGTLAALGFGVFWALTYYVYLSQPFISGFIWIRLGTLLAALSLLILPQVRQVIFTGSQRIKNKVKVSGLFIATHALGGLAFILLNYAASLKHVSLVNALQGVQYVFLLLIIIFLAKKFPQLLKEELAKGIIIQKIAAILLIGSGLVLLAFYSYA